MWVICLLLNYFIFFWKHCIVSWREDTKRWSLSSLQMCTQHNIIKLNVKTWGDTHQSSESQVSVKAVICKKSPRLICITYLVNLVNVTDGLLLSWIWLPLTTTAHHPWTTSPIMHCTHTFPSTITPITQLSPFTHWSWLPPHICTSFSHSHISSTHTLTHCEVLFSPG